MGSFGTGPFDNDDAADLLAELEVSTARGITRALQAVVRAPAGAYLDVDAGNGAWAAGELVAMAFGRAGSAPVPNEAVELAARMKPAELQRALALAALARIMDHAHSELAQLWHDSPDRAVFEATVSDLRARLEAAAQGPRALAKLRAGDVLALVATPPSAGLIVIQVVGAGEVAVFAGTQPDEKAALAVVAKGAARRVPTKLSALGASARVLGNVPVRKDLKGRQYYAMLAGALYEYALVTANGGGADLVEYEQARAHDVFRPRGEAELRAIALGTAREEVLPSPEAREAEYRARNAAHWTERRARTTPGPFGDDDALRTLAEWIRDYGVENAVQRFDELARGMSGYGRPNEREERRAYAFAGLVAVWRGKLPGDAWPAALQSLMPAVPGAKLLRTATEAARVLAAQVITRDAELRFVWDDGPALREAVAALQAALS